MVRGQRRAIPLAVAVVAAILVGGAAIPGCSDERTQTGTVVQQTPEQKAAEQKSMDGMRKAMEGMGKTQAKTH
jgi:hypothetical protein